MNLKKTAIEINKIIYSNLKFLDERIEEINNGHNFFYMNKIETRLQLNKDGLKGIKTYLRKKDYNKTFDYLTNIEKKYSEIRKKWGIK